MSILAMIEEMGQLLAEAAVDAEKADKGNKAAGTRVRKAMQDIKAKAQDARKAVMDARN